MSQERTINEVIENLTGMLVRIAKRGDEEEVKKAVEIMEEGWAKCDAFDFNKELAKLWRESHKAKKETKN